MIIKHLQTYPIFYDWIGNNGRELKHNQVTEVPDKLAFLDKFKNAINRNDIEVISYDAAKYSYVVQEELEDLVGDAGDLIVDNFIVTSNGQTVFSLSDTPKDIDEIICTIMGLEQRRGIDYNVVGAVFTWTSPEFNLSIGEELEVRYFV